MKKSNVVVVGGGTGTSVVLRGLRPYPVDLTAVINVTDSGGSSGRLRDEFGFPPGDFRQCLAALAEDQNLREILTYRFSKGVGLDGHSLGNLVLVALRELYGSNARALEVLGQILKISGRVYPVSLERSVLMAGYEDGTVLTGEHQIDQPSFGGGVAIREVWLAPEIPIYEKAARAIEEAQLIIVGPGDIFTSIAPCFLVEGAKEAMRLSQAKVCLVLNLRNRYSQTHGFSALDYVSAIEGYIGRRVDWVLVNIEPIPDEIALAYQKEQATPIEDDLEKRPDIHVARDNLAGSEMVERVAGDETHRSFFRHDGDKLARHFMRILWGF